MINMEYNLIVCQHDYCQLYLILITGGHNPSIKWARS